MDYQRLRNDCLEVLDFVCGELAGDIDRLSRDIATALQAGGKLMICGNGGSAADAQHMAGEFLNRFLQERPPYAAIALSTDTSTMTAIGNDYSFDDIFAQQVQALGKPGDFLLAISTSGNSRNCLRAMDVARGLHIRTIAMTGGNGGQMADLADDKLNVACTAHTPRVQEGHALIIHLLCEQIENLMIGKDDGDG